MPRTVNKEYAAQHLIEAVHKSVGGDVEHGRDDDRSRPAHELDE